MLNAGTSQKNTSNLINTNRLKNDKPTIIVGFWMISLYLILTIISGSVYAADSDNWTGGQNCVGGGSYASKGAAESDCRILYEAAYNQGNIPLRFNPPVVYVEQPRSNGLRTIYAVNAFRKDTGQYYGVFQISENTCDAGYYFKAGQGCRADTFCTAPFQYNVDTLVCEIPFDKEENNGKQCPAEGNPINVATGNKFEVVRDYVGAGPSPLMFERTYNSDISVKTKRIGEHWQHNFDKAIEVLDNITVKLHLGDGSALIYELQNFTTNKSIWEADTNITHIVTGILDNSTDRNTIEWEVKTNQNTVEKYNADGKLISITYLNGNIQTLSYDISVANGGDGNPDTLDLISDSYGRQLKLSYDISSNIQSLEDPAGQVYTYSYDSNTNLISASYPDETPGNTSDNPVITYHYGENNSPIHALTGITDEKGNRYATWEYDSLGRAISSEHSGGVNSVDLTYNSDGTTTVTDSLGRNQTYHFDISFGKANIGQFDGEACNSCGQSYSNTTYDANGFVSSKTDFRNTTTNYVHNDRGLETSRTEAVGTPEERTIITEWELDYRLPKNVTESGMRETTYTYLNGQEISRTITDLATSEARTTTTAYDTNGLVDTVDGPRTEVSDIIDYDFDANGNLTKITNEIGNVIELLTHDAHGRPVSMTDMNNNTITMNYYPRGWLKSRTIAGKTTSYQYDDVGQLTQISLPSGRSISYHYDNAQRLIAIVDNVGNRIDYTLDSRGNRLKEEYKDSSGTLAKEVNRQYNSLSQLSKIIGSSLPAWDNDYTYDANGNLVNEENGNNQSTVHVYDNLNRRKQSTDSSGGITLYEYNALDYLTKETDPNGNETTYTNNAFGNVVTQVSPDTGTTTMTYDSAGNMVTRTDARAITATHIYNAANLLTRIDYPDGSHIRYLIAGSSNLQWYVDNNSHGRLSSTGIWDAYLGYSDYNDLQQSYTYDEEGRLTSEYYSILNSLRHETKYEYDVDGNLNKITYPSGRVIDYTLDSNGQITVIESTYNGVTETLASNITYYPFGPVKSYIAGNGMTISRQRDSEYRIQSIDASTISMLYEKLDYSYDQNSNISTIVATLDQNISSQINYDNLDRINNFTDYRGDHVYTYDNNGNRLSLNQQSPNILNRTTTYTIDIGSNILSRKTTNSNPNDYIYDAVGNLIDDGEYTYVYNQANRLRAVYKNNVPIASYYYDAFGRRVAKKLPGTDLNNVSYNYDQQGRLIAEIVGLGHTMREYVYLEDIPLALFSNENTFPDHIIRVGEVVGDAGNSALFDINLNKQSVVMESTLAGTLAAEFEPIETYQDTTEFWNSSDQGEVYRSTFGAYGLQFIMFFNPDVGMLLSNMVFNDGNCFWTDPTKCSSNLEVRVRYNTGLLESFQTETVYLLSPPVSPEAQYYLTDHLNTPLKLYDSNQDVTWSASYDAFGEANVDTNSAITQPLRFPGQYYDEETGLHYNWHRYYNPELGRYITSDPIGLAGGMNTYGYALQNPISTTDPLGLNPYKPDPSIKRPGPVDQSGRNGGRTGKPVSPGYKTPDPIGEAISNQVLKRLIETLDLPGALAGRAGVISGAYLYFRPIEMGCADFDCNSNGVDDREEGLLPDTPGEDTSSMCPIETPLPNWTSPANTECYWDFNQTPPIPVCP